MKENNTPTPSHEKVADLARQLWEQDGRQTGRDLEYWVKAEQQLASANAPGNPAKSNPGVRSGVVPSRARLSARR